jgi:hypothetical protein
MRKPEGACHWLAPLSGSLCEVTLRVLIAPELMCFSPLGCLGLITDLGHICKWVYHSWSPEPSHFALRLSRTELQRHWLGWPPGRAEEQNQMKVVPNPCSGSRPAGESRLWWGSLLPEGTRRSGFSSGGALRTWIHGFFRVQEFYKNKRMGNISPAVPGAAVTEVLGGRAGR